MKARIKIKKIRKTIRKIKYNQKGGAVSSPSSVKSLGNRASGRASSNTRSSRNRLSLMSKNSVNENSIRKSQIYKLITSETTSTARIVFKKIVIECILGNNQFIIGTGNYKDSEKCIVIKYFPKREYCSLDSFFFTNTKQKCISKKSLNNSEFKGNHTNSSTGKLSSEYNKTFNKTLIELFDVINTNIGMKYCMLIDGSQLEVEKCGTIIMTILKNIERGYGFYNEFGYLYQISKIDSPTLQINYNESITLSNNVITELIKPFQIMSLEELISDISDVSNVFEQIKKFTLQEIVIELMNYCKKQSDNKADSILEGLDKNDIIELIELITEAIREKLEDKGFSMSQYKLYDYKSSANNNQSRIYHSIFNTDLHKFSMTPMKKYNLSINQLEENKYSIIIE
jgi:hypothetical protein